MLVFKVGTVLKKMYFEDYRFSEDLDFTITKNYKISTEELEHQFSGVFDFIQDCSPNRLAINGEINVNSLGTINFDIGYTSILGGFGSNKEVKVDISTEELVINPPVDKSILKTYSDHIESSLKCYTLEEVLSEKMRATLQRTRPRDLFDLWYLIEVAKINIMDCYSDFVEKTKYKKIDFTNYPQRIEDKFSVFKRQWETSLVHQINPLPKFEDVVRDFGKHLRAIQKHEDLMNKPIQKKKGFRL